MDSWSKRRIALALSFATLLSLGALADKIQPAVVGRWQGAPSSVRLGVTTPLVLHVESSQRAANVIIEVLPSRGVEIVSGASTWTGSLSAGQSLNLPFTARVTANGEWTLGAAITNRRPENVERSGAVLGIIATNGV